jgi:hypothetical protein
MEVYIKTLQLKQIAGLALLIVGALVLLTGAAITMDWDGLGVSQEIVLGGLVGGVVLLGAGAWLYFGRKKMPF